jgi:hypothetical protein
LSLQILPKKVKVLPTLSPEVNPNHTVKVIH